MDTEGTLDEPRRRSAAFFDLDKTIIAKSSSMAFSRSFLEGGLLTRTKALRTAYAQFLFEVGGADERQTARLRDALSELVAGWEVAHVQAIVAETIHDHIDPIVYQEALELIRRHQMNGRDVIIVSASASLVVEPIAELLGADAVIASRMEARDGVLTGEISFYAYGAAKAEAIVELANARGYDLDGSYAYSDSITDAPMLDAVGHGFAVNPDRSMRREAHRRGWGVLTFRRPVGLRRRDAGRPVAVTLLAIAAIGAVWAIAYAAYRREPDA
ncbi:HAD family hydrolase [Demequina sp. SYSU T00039]|uniref:HAD family hydrolase n=1 Tax=Demequina lignilytica TaxID=3051663 RepID=A0AAW7M610_9MICO|nr:MULTISPECIES: HAD family hydrolase [unclassified Demequina]MDN4478604.1 HAD family hydrolase [Demequina sp. SYSU T00039-1]MDN4488582.1 HAD family hydrolase [Demequina sp. SYSU T00039]MDN4491608.1 HAD family hydrolase [Demequina sp. SYSU T00068]